MVCFRRAFVLLESEIERRDGVGIPSHEGINRSQGNERPRLPGIIGEDGLEALGSGLEVRAPHGNEGEPAKHFGVSGLSHEERAINRDCLGVFSKRLAVLAEEQRGSRPVWGDAVERLGEGKALVVTAEPQIGERRHPENIGCVRRRGERAFERFERLFDPIGFEKLPRLGERILLGQNDSESEGDEHHRQSLTRPNVAS